VQALKWYDLQTFHLLLAVFFPNFPKKQKSGKFKNLFYVDVVKKNLKIDSEKTSCGIGLGCHTNFSPAMKPTSLPKANHSSFFNCIKWVAKILMLNVKGFLVLAMINFAKSCRMHNFFHNFS
jgi:hypothetical protein